MIDDPNTQDDLLNDRLREMLEQLSRSLFDAISESEDVHEHLRRLREEGYSLNLLLDCQPQEEEEADGESETAEDSPAVRTGIVPSEATDRRPRAKREAPPVFRIDGQDLAFLRDLGIDPTRRCKSKSQKRRLPSERLADDS